MKWLNVEKGLLEEYKMLLEIPKTRQFLDHAKETCKIEFAQYIKEYIESKNTGKNNTDCNEKTARPIDTNDPDLLQFNASTVFEFHLEYSNDKWQPFVELRNTCFDSEDILPGELIELISAHSFAQYRWYFIENKEFQTRNYGLREFDVSFKYMTEKFISGKVQIIFDSGTDSISFDRESPAGERNNIIHMNRNQKHYQDMLSDKEAYEFLHYFFTFPFLRDAVLIEFNNKIKPFLTDKFEASINQWE